MRSPAARGGAAASAPPAGALALAALALAVAVAAAAVPLVDLLSCMKLWQHGAAACLP